MKGVLPQTGAPPFESLSTGKHLVRNIKDCPLRAPQNNPIKEAIEPLKR
jgi:hypothetical protein